MNKIKLSNGVEMPQLGYGVYQVTPDECERCVSDALSVGYRMIDTAQVLYHNEEEVGKAIANSGISRNEIFLVSKIGFQTTLTTKPSPRLTSRFANSAQTISI